MKSVLKHTIISYFWNREMKKKSHLICIIKKTPTIENSDSRLEGQRRHNFLVSMQIFKKFSQLSIFYSEYVSFLYPHATTVKKADKCTINHSLLHSHSVSSHASHKFVSSGGKPAGGEGDCAGAEMVGPQRPQFVLFGSSIVQLSYANGGWGAILSDVYARKVLPLALFFHILNASFWVHR